MKREAVVVGAGLSGSVMARELAEKHGYHVKVVERRNHIAGNVYDIFEDGILIQKYGPHFLATFSWEVVAYLKRFTDFYEYPIKAKSYLNGKYIDRPYNFRTLQQLLGPENSSVVLEHIRKAFPNLHRITLKEIMESDDEIVAKYGKLLYDEIFAPYCSKQWGLKVEELSPDVINRTDIVLGYEVQLDDTDFQYLPCEGFTEICKKILDHENIEIVLEEDAISHMNFDEKSKLCIFDSKAPDIIYYTGMLDELFNYEYGELPYRSRHFTYQKFNVNKKLQCGVITYPKEKEYLRQTEFCHFNPDRRTGDYTIVQTEYSLPMDRKSEKGNEPYYPVLSEESINLSNKYKIKADEYKNLYYGGRLGDFRYYDMDTAILKTLDKINEIKGDN